MTGATPTPSATLPTPPAPASSVVQARGPERYIAVRDFRLTINGTSMSFKKGALFSEDRIIKIVLDQRAPVTAVKDEDDLVVCPHCRAAFEIKLARETDRLIREFGR